MRSQAAALFVMLLALVIGPVFAQGDCPAIIQQVLSTLDATCQQTGRNQACYGNVSINATARQDAANFRFEQVGDIADVTAIQTLRLSPLDATTNQWGVAMLRLQANLPDTLPGQNVTFLLFGDVELTNAAAPGSAARPMQAFYLKTGLNDSQCNQAPQSGLLVQTPQGVGQVTFSVNGVDMSLGSTVFFQAQPGGHMRIATFKGTAVLRYRGNLYPIVQGTQLTAPLNDQLEVDNDPDSLDAYEADEFDSMPVDALDEPIEITPPLTEAELDDLYNRLNNDEPLCGEDPYPPCEDYPALLGGDSCMLSEDGSQSICDESAWDDTWGSDGVGDTSYDEATNDNSIDENTPPDNNTGDTSNDNGTDNTGTEVNDNTGDQGNDGGDTGGGDTGGGDTGGGDTGGGDTGGGDTGGGDDSGGG